ncbi:MAG: NUDIX hydrolase [Coriobacteriia bacterium]|nr:NUDIX hydrolase [Coriobacteriia bacterium]
MIIPEILSTTTPYQGLIATIELDTLSRGTGEPFMREVVAVPDAVAIAAVDEQGRILLIKQYRHSMKSPVWEIPAGRMDVEGETPLETAARELKEEADLAAKSMQLLTVFGNSVGWCSEKTHLFLAKELSDLEAFERQNEEADIQKAWVSLSEARAMIEDGSIADAKTIIGVLLAT